MFCRYIPGIKDVPALAGRREVKMVSAALLLWPL
jgi:hypothetical protein